MSAPPAASAAVAPYWAEDALPDEVLLSVPEPASTLSQAAPPSDPWRLPDDVFASIPDPLPAGSTGAAAAAETSHGTEPDSQDTIIDDE